MKTDFDDTVLKLRAIEAYQKDGKCTITPLYTKLLDTYGFQWRSSKETAHIYFTHCNFIVNIWPNKHKMQLNVKNQTGKGWEYQGVESILEKLFQLYHDAI